MTHRSSPSRARRLAALAALVSFGALAAPTPALAQPKPTAAAADAEDPADDPQLYTCAKAKGLVSVSFKPEIELKDLLAWAMSFTCKNFMYDQSVMSRSKKLTIIAPNKMTAEQAYRLFLSGLATMGLTVVPKGNVLKVVEASQAKTDTVAIKRGTPAATDEFVRLIIRPEHVPAQDLSDALSAVKSPEGDIKVIGRAGILLVTDYGSHVRDMATLAREIDKPSEGAGVYTIRVQYADAKQLADTLGQVLGTSGGAAAGQPAPTPQPVKGRAATTAADIEAAIPSKILADDRTNTLILVSNEAAYLRVRALVKRLDVALETESGGTIHVHYLENAKAEELAQTLNAALQGITQPQAGQPGAQGGRRPQPAPQPAPGAVDGTAFEGDVRITHDTPTNSLVVISSGRDYQALRGVIKKLDAPRRQVFIEAVIVELNASNGYNIGTSFHGGVPTDDGGVVIGGFQNGTTSSLNVSSLATQSGLIGGLLGPLLEEAEELLGVSIPSYGVLFTALANNSNANVLSSPHLLTTDNVEAEISVGQNIPYQAGTTITGLGLPGGAGSTGFPGVTQPIQRQDIALTMKITPHVNASDMVRLDIEQEIQDLGEETELGPTWTKRKIKTTVVVRDQQSIVIGGLMSDRVNYRESKIPILGDIPLLGYLFKYTEKQTQKTNLLVLLTPYIIEDALDIDQIVERKVRERAEFLRSFSQLDAARYLPTVDYRKKRGLVEEINSTVEAVQRDIEALRALEQGGPVVPEGPVRYEEEPAPAEEPAAEEPTTTPGGGT